MNWLFKEEPSNYDFDALVRDGRTSWTGVRNPLAQKHLKSVKKGERIFFYHTRPALRTRTRRTRPASFTPSTSSRSGS